jgi:quinolinate synthase
MLSITITAAGDEGSGVFLDAIYAQNEHKGGAMATARRFGDEPLGIPSFTDEIREELAPVYERLRNVVPEIEWPVHAPYIAAIRRLKASRGAAILAHNYQTPEIFHGVADLTGDSLALARAAAQTDARVIVVCGVHFMAETAKLLNPEKLVLSPDPSAGCSLASAITAEDVRALRRRHPGVPVVSYVNTSAAVKAESDICCTSANAVHVVESLKTDRVIFIPDEFLGRHVASQTGTEIILWAGHCEVHERFSAGDIRRFRTSYDELSVLAHPECPPDVLAEADFVGSTAGMIRRLEKQPPKRALLLTECSMSDNVSVEFPGIEFVRPCNLCPHMKQITLPGILQCLRRLEPVVDVPARIAVRARRAVERMIEIGAGKAPSNG